MPSGVCEEFTLVPSHHQIITTGSPIPIDMFSTAIYVTNVDPYIQDNIFILFFQFCGAIKQFSFHRSKKHALVHFESPMSVLIAKQLDGTKLGSSYIKIETISLYETEQTKEIQSLFQLLFIPRHGVVPVQNSFSSVIISNSNTTQTQTHSPGSTMAQFDVFEEMNQR